MNRRGFLAGAAVALAAAAALTINASEWNQLRRQMHPDHPSWPALIRAAEAHGLTPDDVEGAYVTLHGPQTGAMALVVVHPAHGGVLHLSADGVLR